MSVLEAPPVEGPPPPRPAPALALPDRVFRGVSRGAAIATFVLLGLIAFFLVLKSAPALHRAGFSFFTRTQWLPATGNFGIAALLWGTVTIALIAMVIAVPVAIGAALFITEYVPARLRGPLIGLVDLMAAVPSIIYGIWGLFFLQPRMIPVSRWLSDHLGGVLPFLKVNGPQSESAYTSSAFIGAAVVSMMVLPTATSVMREVFSQAPVAEREGAIALGASRWGVIRTVVLPFGRGGIIAGSMLALGRALGETIALALIISPMFHLTTHPLKSGTNSISVHILLRFEESGKNDVAALLGAGLVLFAFTLAVNTVAGILVSRSRSGASTEI